VQPPTLPLHAGEDVGHEHDVDGLANLRQHQPAHLPIAQVGGQQQDALAREAPLHDAGVAGHALDEKGGLRRCPRRELQEVHPCRKMGGDHLERQTANLRRALGDVENDGEVRPRRPQVFRVEAIVDARQPAAPTVHRPARKRACEGESRGKPHARGRGGHCAREPIARRHFLLHGGYPKGIDDW
jgi:hypothetical protein